jgi:hypothetical protein
MLRFNNWQPELMGRDPRMMHPYPVVEVDYPSMTDYVKSAIADEIGVSKERIQLVDSYHGVKLESQEDLLKATAKAYTVAPKVATLGARRRKSRVKSRGSRSRRSVRSRRSRR